MQIKSVSIAFMLILVAPMAYPMNKNTINTTTLNHDTVLIEKYFKVIETPVFRWINPWQRKKLSEPVSYEELNTQFFKKSVDVNTQDKNGKTALHYAIEQGNNDLFNGLIAHPGIDASIADKDGNTPLLLLPKNFRMFTGKRDSGAVNRITKGLLGCGASLFDTNKNQETIIHCWAKIIAAGPRKNYELKSLELLIQEVFMESLDKQEDCEFNVFLCCILNKGNRTNNPMLPLDIIRDELGKNHLSKQNTIDSLFNRLISLKDSNGNTAFNILEKAKPNLYHNITYLYPFAGQAYIDPTKKTEDKRHSSLEIVIKKYLDKKSEKREKAKKKAQRKKSKEEKTSTKKRKSNTELKKKSKSFKKTLMSDDEFSNHDDSDYDESSF